MINVDIKIMPIDGAGKEREEGKGGIPPQFPQPQYLEMGAYLSDFFKIKKMFYDAGWEHFRDLRNSLFFVETFDGSA